MKTALLLSLLVATLSLGNSANILGIFPLPARSHYVMFERLMKRLAEKGHYVDVAGHYPSKEVPPRYNQLSLAGSVPLRLNNNFSVSTIKDYYHYDWLHFTIKTYGVDVCDATFNTQALQDLKKSQKKYDLVVTQLYGSDCMLGFGYIFKAPTVSLISSVALPWAGDRVGNPDNPAYIPNFYGSSTAKMTLYERIENLVYLVASKIAYDFLWSGDSNRLCREFFGQDVPSVEELTRNTSLILVNSHFSFSYARPTVPNFIEVGGLHIHEPKPLTKYFEDLMTTDTKGIIYLSTGSLVTTESFPPEKLQGMFDAFEVLPYKILWKADSGRFPKGLKIPDNIHFEKWMPQMDILCHPNVKLFVSHGGLMGSQEAIYCRVPILGIPFFVDQYGNIRSLETMGLAIEVAYEEINKETILNAAKKLLEDPTYQQNAERASRQFKDRPMSPLDTAVYWMEYVIRHNGAPHLRSAGADLPWYQYFLVDVVLILLGLSMAMVLSIVLVVKCVLKILRNKQKEKTN